MPHKWKPKTLTCSECQRTYTIVHPKKARRFCSRRCSSIASNRARGDRRVDIVCQHCGTTASVPKCFQATKFCSRTCYNAAVGRVEKPCERCGAPFMGWLRRQRFCSKKCRGLAGRKAKGYVSGQGYQVVYVDAQPVLEHRLAMERRLGRKLLPAETVHHKDGNRLNNADSNLELWDKSQPAGQRVEDKIQWCLEFLRRHGIFPGASFHEVS